MKSSSLITFLSGLAAAAAAAVTVTVPVPVPDPAVSDVYPRPLTLIEGTPTVEKRAAAAAVSNAVPSIAPIILTGDRGQAVFISYDGQALIGNKHSTLLKFTFPENMHATKRCALQFRMPACVNLPAGYPCYKWSGLEQEVSKGSGFHIIPLDEVYEWRATASDDSKLQGIAQVYPGAVVELGTFICGWTDQSALFLMENRKDFSISFKQGTDKGVGFWVVPSP